MNDTTPAGAANAPAVSISAPETATMPAPENAPPQPTRNPAALRCWSAYNRRLVAGQPVRLRVGAEPRDRYGRLLAYVYRRRDGLFVNAVLVRDGYATTLTIPPNDAQAAQLARLERSARRAGRGLWRACT